ncbi:hypothetical protein PYW07_008756 [Mythimna separata]|uniref:Uncharacterized protein n=1 Tax=Mythimna separata TaxID=271217 RepID=A0AAD8DPC2_MYTSE|nr:hypothetical protein PYW07_008756 [Mythimna separata]
MLVMLPDCPWSIKIHGHHAARLRRRRLILYLTCTCSLWPVLSVCSSVGRYYYVGTLFIKAAVKDKNGVNAICYTLCRTKIKVDVRYFFSRVEVQITFYS